MKVKLIRPPAIQSQVRGAGFYGANLDGALRGIKDLEIVERGQDISHYLYFDLFFLTLPPIRKNTTVVTVYDLTPIVLKEMFNPGIRGEIKWRIQREILKNVDAVITISQSAKIDIEKYVGIPSSKIYVTYLAASKICKPQEIKKDNSIVYIGDLNPNKNLHNLLKAVSLLKDEKLILIGKAFTQNDLPEAIDIKREIEKFGIGSRVETPGFVTEAEKIRLLNMAKVYIQPSIYEGFGLPVIEAMACGTPVICGNNSSLPEIAGKAAVYVDITDPKKIAEAISSVKQNKKECIAQAEKFSWEKTAQETYEIYQKVFSGS